MSYLNSVATAHSVVDSVIAMAPDGPAVVAEMGHRRSVASGWRSRGQQRALGHRIQPGTGLDYRGVVATGTPFNVEGIVKQAGPDMALPPNLGPAANSYTGYILAGLREARLDLDIDSVLTLPGWMRSTRPRCCASRSWTRRSPA